MLSDPFPFRRRITSFVAMVIGLLSAACSSSAWNPDPAPPDTFLVSQVASSGRFEAILVECSGEQRLVLESVKVEGGEYSLTSVRILDDGVTLYRTDREIVVSGDTEASVRVSREGEGDFDFFPAPLATDGYASTMFGDFGSWQEAQEACPY